MADGAAEREDARDTEARGRNGEVDERKIGLGIAIALPAATIVGAVAGGLGGGASLAILVLAAGLLLGVIALFWASLRVLSGDAPISPELEALDASAQAVDALGARKKMLLRALKDLDNERAVGKLDDDDHEQLAQTYRSELKEVLKRIDASLEPHRGAAEKAARAYLAKVGLAEQQDRGAPPSDPAPDSDPDLDSSAGAPSSAKTSTKERMGESTRVSCAKCSTANDADAAFCKKCGEPLAAPATASEDAKVEASDET